MAFGSSRRMGAVAAAVHIAMLVAATKVVLVVQAQVCPEEEYVYPYWTVCTVPARYYEAYYFISPIVGQGVVVPEWDETNATYYVKFNSITGAQGAKYVVAPAAGATSTTLAAAAGAIEGAIPLNESVTIYNNDSMRALGWRSEGPDQWALVELTSSDNLTQPASFRFLKVDCFSLPCFSPSTPPRCESYYLLSDPASTSASVGWLTHSYKGNTYIRAASTSGSVGDLPIFLRDAISLGAIPHAAV